MAITAWDDLDFGVTLSTLTGQCKSANILTGEQFESGQQATLETIISNAKDDLKNRIMGRALECFPQGVAYYSNLYANALRKSNNGFGVGMNGYISIVSGTLYPYTDKLSANPKVFVSNDTPTDGLFNNSARNGMFCWDYLNRMLYINRGSLTATHWVQWDVIGLYDFLNNPQVLFTSAMYGALYQLFEWAANNDEMNSFSQLQYRAGQEQRQSEKYEAELKRCLPFLRMDISGDEIIDNYEMSRSINGDSWAVV